MKRIAALTVSLALLIPGAAVASANGGATGQSYGQAKVKQVDHAKASRSPSAKTTAPAAATKSPGVVNAANATTTTSAGSLPFTGLDLGALGGGAVLLLGAGMVLRRASTDRR